MKFRWKPNYDIDRRKLITRKIKSKLKETPTLPDNLMRGYYTDFHFTVPSGGMYRFFYAGGDTSKGGIYYIVEVDGTRHNENELITCM
jgi:hypothetical protein